MDSIIHGAKYEQYVKFFLTKKYKHIWLWNEIPIDILQKLNIISPTQITCDDIGCDILAETNDNIYHYIQCKNYSTIGIDNTINICDLSGFYNFMAENKLSNGIVYYSGYLSSQIIKRSKAIKYVNLPYNTCKSITLTPYSYQIDAITKLSYPGRNILTMPCGTGKTYVSYLLSISYKNIIVLSPLISTAEQLYAFYKQYYQNSETCNISIFNCKNKSVNKIINLQKQNIIISTYDSVNLIYDNVSLLTNKIIVIDEYHNLSNNNLINTNDPIYKILNFNDSTYLFMSATPHKQMTMYTNIFGTNEYKLSWEDAISKKYICDYKFYYPNPEMIKTKITELKQSSVISQIEINKCILLNKAYYLLECIKEFNVKKIIVFLKSIAESIEFSKILNILNLFFDNRLLVNEINCNTSKVERTKILARFKNKNETVNILCNVHILDEGIDIPECDSVYLTHPNYNPINFIQRISRCNRIKPKDSGIANIANIFIWAKDENKVAKVDRLISEYLVATPTEISNNKYVRNIRKLSNCEPVINVNENINVTTKENCGDIVDYIIKNTNIPENFVRAYNNFYELSKNNNGYGIPLENVVTYLGISNQLHFEERIRKLYILNTDYIIIRTFQKSTKGVKDANYMLTCNTFERICINSTTKTGIEFRKHYSNLQKSMIEYNKLIK